MTKSYIHSCVLLACFFTFITPSFAQQQLFIVGDNDPAVNNDGSPELYIQDGADAFIYVQGGVTVITNPGDAFPAEIANNGAIFIDNDAGTPGNFVHINNSANDLRIDKTTSGAFSVTTPPATAHAQSPGTVHLMAGGTQEISNGGVAAGTGIHFFSLSIDGTGTQTRNITGVPLVTTGTTSGGGASNSGVLFLQDDVFAIGSNTLEVRNTAEAAVERAAANSAPYAIAGMNPVDHMSTPTGMVVATGANGRFGRATDGIPATPYLYPIGTIGSTYRPATIFSGTSDMVYGQLVAPNLQAAPSFFSPTAGETPLAVDPFFVWRLGTQTAGGNANTNVRLYETLANMSNSGLCLPADLLEDLGVAQKSSANLWADENPGISTGGGGNGVDLYWAESGNQIANGANTMVQWLNVGEEFTLDMRFMAPDPQDGCAPFPIEMITLRATPIQNSYIRLDWTTPSEVNNDHFELERSTDGVNFAQINQLPTAAPGGNSNTPIDYSQNDFNVTPDIRYFYRVKMRDIGGGTTLSNIVSAMLVKGTTHIGAVYPNPTNGDINIQISSANDSEYKFRIYNPLGQEIYTHDVETKAGDNIIHLDLSKLAIGTYQLVITEQGKHQGTLKIIRY